MIWTLASLATAVALFTGVSALGMHHKYWIAWRYSSRSRARTLYETSYTLTTWATGAALALFTYHFLTI